LSKKIAGVNSSNIEDFKKTVEDLAKKNETSKEVLEQIHTTLEDFEASYISNSHNEDRENYNTILTQL
jgi:ribosomal protein L9